ncbi:MAG: exo-alpha-sialidase [Bacteroidetes bacterium]|nr:exo-alpha-sialidase [Bacteroidota bacterium]
MMIVSRRSLFVLAFCLGFFLLPGCRSETVGSGEASTSDAWLSVQVDSGIVARPTLTVLPDTNIAMVAWFKRVNDTWGVFVRRYVGGSANGEDVLRLDGEEGAVRAHEQAPPVIVSGRDGRAYVSWTTRTGTSPSGEDPGDVWIARSLDYGKTWQPPVRVNQGSSSVQGPLAASHTFHDVVVTPSGTVVVSWIDTRNQVAAQHASREGHAALNGQAPIQWVHDDFVGGKGAEVRIAVSRDEGQTFEETTILDSRTCPCCQTALTVSPNGAVYAAWRHIFSGNERDIVMAVSGDDGATFSKPRRVYRDAWKIAACPHTGPSIVASADSVGVLWYTGAEGRAGSYWLVDNALALSNTAALPKQVGFSESLVRHDAARINGRWVIAVEDGMSGETVLYPDTVSITGTRPSLAAMGELAMVTTITEGAVYLQAVNVAATVRSQ